MRSRVLAGERPLPLGFKWPNREVPIAFINVSPYTSSSSSSSFSFSSSSSSSFSSSSRSSFPTSPSSPSPTSLLNDDSKKNIEKNDVNMNKIENISDDRNDYIIPYFIKQYESTSNSNSNYSTFISSSSSTSTSSSTTTSSTPSSTSFSYSNLAEAEVLCGVVQGFLDQGMTLDQVWNYI